jgi:hypothetical protein
MPLPSTSLCPVWLASREALHKWAAAHVASLAVRSLSSVSRGSAYRLVFAMRLAKRFAILKHEKGGLSPANSLYAERRD